MTVEQASTYKATYVSQLKAVVELYGVNIRLKAIDDMLFIGFAGLVCSVHAGRPVRDR